MSNDTQGRDVSAEILNRKVTHADALGKTPAIPHGVYNDCTVNIRGAKVFENEDGTENTSIRIKFTCPSHDGDLTTSFSYKFGPKAPFGKLFRACFPGLDAKQMEGKTAADLNGKRVNMIVTPDSFNGKAINQFNFLAPTPAKK